MEDVFRSEKVPAPDVGVEVSPIAALVLDPLRAVGSRVSAVVRVAVRVRLDDEGAKPVPFLPSAWAAI